MSNRFEVFGQRGWLSFGADPKVARWAAGALSAARQAVRDPANAHWLRGNGSWFVGVDALPNDARGAVDDGPPLDGAVMAFIRAHLDGADVALHRAQVSVCYPGFPQPMNGESERAYRFRLEHDGAHVDGLLIDGPARRRFLREPHAWVLGLPLAVGEAGAAPPVLWEGSHRIMHAAFANALAGHPAEAWPKVDLTEAYQCARREAFSRCPRIVIDAQPGEAFLMHRHLVHGVAPWTDAARAGPDGRIVAYFRPQFARVELWLDED
jgi:hypothetical protein